MVAQKPERILATCIVTIIYVILLEYITITITTTTTITITIGEKKHKRRIPLLIQLIYLHRRAQ
jgi:hypothetical protein